MPELTEPQLYDLYNRSNAGKKDLDEIIERLDKIEDQVKFLLKTLKLRRLYKEYMKKSM